MFVILSYLLILLILNLLKLAAHNNLLTILGIILGLLGLLVGGFLGILSVALAYWGIHTTKKANEAMINIVVSEARILKIAKMYYLFCRIELQNMGAAWVRFTDSTQAGYEIYHPQKIADFAPIINPNINNKIVWEAAKIFGSINFERINRIPETTLFPRGGSYDFYFIGESKTFSKPSTKSKHELYTEIYFTYETEKGVLKGSGKNIVFTSIKSTKKIPIPLFKVIVPIHFLP